MFLSKEERASIKAHKEKVLQERKDKEKLLSSKSDWTLLEKLIKEVNKDKNLRFEVRLTDGTKFFIASYEPKRVRDIDLINGDYSIVE